MAELVFKARSLGFTPPNYSYRIAQIQCLNTSISFLKSDRYPSVPEA